MKETLRKIDEALFIIQGNERVTSDRVAEAVELLALAVKDLAYKMEEHDHV